MAGTGAAARSGRGTIPAACRTAGQAPAILLIASLRFRPAMCRRGWAWPGSISKLARPRRRNHLPKRPSRWIRSWRALPEGIRELEAARDLAPADAATRWALATAYARAGRNADAARERAENKKLKDR
jgi:hypothetical protein